MGYLAHEELLLKLSFTVGRILRTKVGGWDAPYKGGSSFLNVCVFLCAFASLREAYISQQ
jgi:hypothetical protein